MQDVFEDEKEGGDMKVVVCVECWRARKGEDEEPEVDDGVVETCMECGFMTYGGVWIDLGEWESDATLS